ncbi:MAG TPA: tRNA preQ1(34) S-adenosylmethionine ribosyltransferase-isomerase QueA [Candidatus Binatia bacterium]|nr:tRNA preQ1(34) S-adenosylmethionine ribosyltransferase-isomerase QueA [Candidatus Binatia bacterium]
MLVSDFNFHLPEELIAQQGLPSRDASRMLHLDRTTGAYRDRMFQDLPDLLRPTDVLVFNNSRVFPARLYGRRKGIRSQTPSPHNPASRDFLHGTIEVLLTRQISSGPNDWECLVRPGRKIGVGELLFFGDNNELQAEVLTRGAFGERLIRFTPNDQSQDFFAILDRIGHIPLPPYIGRPDSTADRERYQTVYARQRGSIAAPTAGLHFTPEILSRIRSRGIQTAEITLHVGLGTFQPVRVERVEEHKLHSEAYSISGEAAAAINRALETRGRIVAVGTTTVRTLEYAVRQGMGRVAPGSGAAGLFIYPGYEFRAVGAMLTNFHLPQSTLLMLVCGFAGRENVLRAYAHAVSGRYRFYSYGDCMFIE